MAYFGRQLTSGNYLKLEELQAVATALWTPEVIAAYEASLESNQLS